MTNLTDDFWRLAEEHKRLKEELERLKKQHDWDHEVLMHIDNHGLDYSYDYFLYLRTHGGWCPKCETIDTAEGGEFYGGRELQSPNDDGQYECGICYHNEVTA
tara:strand:+ start:148 stop:456 length:309 start_codon:yes stop_codon:yes gene_type:complete